MIASDTSTWIAFLEGNSGDDVEMLTKALGDRQVVMAPAVLTELLSDPKLPSSAAHTLSDLPLIDISPGYWQRAGALRAQVLAKKRKARLVTRSSPRAVSTAEYRLSPETVTSRPSLRPLGLT